MSITMTYRLAHRARAKLGHEAAQPSHNLRRLVGHANLLDSLMSELHAADQAPTATEPRHVQWAPAERRVVDEPESDDDALSESSEEDDDDSDYDESDAESDYDDSEDMLAFQNSRYAATLTQMRRQAAQPVADEYSSDDDEEDISSLRLVRTQSHSAMSPPDLSIDDSSDDEVAMPPSPESSPLDMYRPELPTGKESPLFLDVPPRSPSRLTPGRF